MFDKITALYCRYSRDDGQEEENASITHQRELLKEYAENNGYTNLRCYADDGYSGTNFNRPDFQRMLEDIENGLIGTVIVKDMSRFGRNYILVGQYVELVLPMYDVKVIGVTDHYDSTKENNDLFAFESIFAEMYAADISKKVTAYKRNKGMNGGVVKTRPVYGYKIAPDTKDEWIIDEKVAGIVYMIFDKFVNEEMTEYQIANYLRKHKVLTTSAYAGSKRCDPTRIYAWSTSTITRMLGMAEYAGDTVNFKSRTVSFKTRQIERIPKDQWLVFHDTHDAIIPREMFEKAQVRLARPKKRFDKRKYEYNTFFARKCRCSECGGRMAIQVAKGYDGIAYNCQKKISFQTCKSHSVREMTLRNMFKDQITALQQALLSKPKEIEEKLGVYQISDIQKEIDVSNQRIAEINSYMQELFESKIRGEITQDDFLSLSRQYGNEKSNLQSLVNMLAEKLAIGKKNASGIVEIMTFIQNTDFSEITEEICSKLIKQVIVGVYEKKGTVNYGKQPLRFQIYEIGFIDELVDVSYKTFRERIEAVLLRRYADHIVTKRPHEVYEELGLTYNTMKKGLQRENTNFNTIVIELRKKLITEYIRQGMSADEIFRITGFSNVNVLYAFCYNNFEVSYKHLRKVILS